jgi:hypothetical protein
MCLQFYSFSFKFQLFTEKFFNFKLFHVNVDTRSNDRADSLSLAAVLFVRPLREHSLVEIEENGVERLHLSVKHALHVSVRAQRFLDVTNSAALCPQLAGLEVVDVLVVVEHEANGGGVTVNLEGMSAENDAFEDDTVGCAGKQTSVGDKRH